MKSSSNIIKNHLQQLNCLNACESSGYVRLRQKSDLQSHLGAKKTDKLSTDVKDYHGT